MPDQSSDADVEVIRRAAAASGIELTDDRAEQLVAAVVRYRGQVAKLDRLDLGEREPGIADPAAGR